MKHALDTVKDFGLVKDVEPFKFWSKTWVTIWEEGTGCSLYNTIEGYQLGGCYFSAGRNCQKINAINKIH